MGKIFRHLDLYITVLLVILGLSGSFILLTVETSFFVQQILYLVIGFVLLVLFSNAEPIILRWIAPACYVFGCIFLAASYLGPSIRGATRWIVIAGNQFQPSEMVKPFMLLGFSYAITKYPPKTIKNMVLHGVLFLIPFLLIFKQPDLGSSLVYGAMWVGMLLAGGFSIFGFLSAIFACVVALPLFWNMLADYQKSRILTFLYPTMDPQGAGYNAIQSMITVGSGQWFGKGLGLGTQSHLRFLPEFHTDFIFATLIEELGFVGGFLLFLFYGILLWRIISPFIQKQSDDAFLFIFTAGLFSMLLSQIVINTGMNMSIIPITGITLPLISYGGSSLLSVMSSFGLLMALRRQGKR